MKPARQVVKPTTHRSVGIVHVGWFQPEGIVHESELEAAFVRHAVLCPATRTIHAQPFRLAWCDTEGTDREYVPDYLVTLTDGSRIVVEVRPARFVNQDRAKFSAAAASLAAKRIGYTVVTDEHLSAARQQIDRLILRAARGNVMADRIAPALALVGAKGVDGLLWSRALASEVPEPDWHHLIGRRVLVADTGIELSPSSRLFLPLNWPGVRDHERLQFERWFGCQAWGPNT